MPKCVCIFVQQQGRCVTAADPTMFGTCMTSNECNDEGGTASGNCAAGKYVYERNYTKFYKYVNGFLLYFQVLEFVACLLSQLVVAQSTTIALIFRSEPLYYFCRIFHKVLKSKNNKTRKTHIKLVFVRLHRRKFGIEPIILNMSFVNKVYIVKGPKLKSLIFDLWTL